MKNMALGLVACLTLAVVVTAGLLALTFGFLGTDVSELLAAGIGVLCGLLGAIAGYALAFVLLMRSERRL